MQVRTCLTLLASMIPYVADNQSSKNNTQRYDDHRQRNCCVRQRTERTHLVRSLCVGGEGKINRICCVMGVKNLRVCANEHVCQYV